MHTWMDRKADFPILQGQNRGKPLVYLDSAASSQKPTQVVEAMRDFYYHDYANIHRGIYELSARATQQFERVREKVRKFINAQDKHEIVFVKGTTEAINLVANSYGENFLQAGDEIILSELEHHSNIVPWYLLAKKKNLQIKVIPLEDDGSLNLERYRALFTTRTKFVAISHVSNALGTINPVKAFTHIAHEHGVPILIDGAQAVAHQHVDVMDIDCDFYAFSAHKLYGPTGVGVLYGKKSLLDAMPPYQGGGDMIETVAFDHISFAPVPHKFEAGTPDIAAVIGFSAALDYVHAVGMDAMIAHEQALLQLATQLLLQVEGLKIIGTAHDKVGVISFVMKGIHPHDLGTVLDHEGVAIRAGHHCAMPVMTRFQIPATVRASFGLYNEEKDIYKLIEGIQLAKRIFD